MIAKGVMVMQELKGLSGGLNRTLKLPSHRPVPRFKRGFTLIELMIVMVIIAITLTLAVPTFKATVEKRRLVSATEEIVSFMAFAQSEAIKRGEKVSVSWHTPGGHDANWCIGASLSLCDCMETVTTEADFCSIGSVPYRLVQSDFVDMDYEFIHMNPTDSSFAFDPVRGIVVDIADAESVDGDWLFYLHSDEKVDGVRLYELELSMYATGRMSICADDDRYSIIAGYPIC